MAKMDKKSQEIFDYIENNFDWRMSISIFSHLFDYGILEFKTLTDEEIAEQIAEINTRHDQWDEEEKQGSKDGHITIHIMTREFEIAFANTCVYIAKNYSTIEIMKASSYLPIR